jgi:hypothetical protein
MLELSSRLYVFFGGVATAGDDGTNSSTPMHVAMHSMPLSPEDPALVALPDTENPRPRLPRAWVHSGPGYVEDL